MDGQTRWKKSLSQLVNFLSTRPLLHVRPELVELCYDYQLSKAQQSIGDKCFGIKMTISSWENFLISCGHNDTKGQWH